MKKLLCILLSGFFIALSIPIVPKAEGLGANQCGENLFWSFDEATATLTVSGEGEMEDYKPGHRAPWWATEAEIDHIVIGEGVTTVGDRAFDTIDAKTLTLPSTLLRIGYRAFFGSAFTELEIPHSVVSIGEHAFAYSDCLRSVIIEDGNLSMIGECAFYNCPALETVILPQNPVSVGMLAFSFTAIRSLTVPQGFTEICERAFAYIDNLESAHIAGTVKKIGDSAFEGCSNLKELVLEEGLTEIGKKAFDGKSKLESVVFPDSLKCIGEYAFYNCYRLKNVVFGSNIESIGDYAFYMTGLKAVFLPESNGYTLHPFDSSVIIYGVPGSSAEWYSPFIPLPNLTVESVSSNKIAVIPISGMEYSIDGEHWQEEPVFTGLTPDTYYTVYHRYAADGERDASPYGTRLTVKTNVGEYMDDSFWDYSADEGLLTVSGDGYLHNYGSSWAEQEWYAYKNKIKSLTVQNAEKIGTWAFSKLTGLKSLSLSEGLRVIGAHAFENAVSLQKLALPSSVEEIGDYAFCRAGLTGELDLSRVSVIGDKAFADCSGITCVRFSENPLYIGFGAFSGGSDITFVFPKEAEFIAPDFWKNCENATIICQKNSSVEEYALRYGVNYRIFGDFNDDKALNAQDFIQLRKLFINCEQDSLIADINADGVVDIRDMVYFKKLLADI